MSTPLVLDGLSHSYPGADQPSVSQIDLAVEPGELVALLGPSGCGKTTTLELVAGLLSPTAGDILVDGRSVLGRRPEERPVAMVFQQPLLFPHMDVAANVGFGLRMRGVGRREIAERVARHLELVRLPDLGDRAVGQLSGGQQQRVSLARALVVEPRLLLLDEPLSALDANLRDELRDLLRSLHDELGITTVMVTHDQQEAVVLADRIALMLDGRIHQVGPPADFYRRPASAAVAAFFGTSNVIDGELDDRGFSCALGTLAVTAADGVRGPARLLLRPEALALGPGHGRNELRGLVRRTTYLGTAVRFRIDVDGVELVGSVLPGPPLSAGDEITVHVDPDDAWVIARS